MSSELAKIGVGFQIGSLDKRLHQPDIPINAAQEKLNAERMYGRQLRLNKGYVGAAAQPTYGYFSFEPVVSGRIQEVLFLSIWGVDPFTVTTGQAIGFISSYQPQDSNTEPPFPNLVLAPSALPVVNAPSRRQVLVFPSERFIICVKGLVNNAQLNASISVVEYEMSSFLKGLVP